MAKIDLSKIEELLERLSVNNDTHEIKFTLLPVNTTHVREENGTKLFDLRAIVDVTVKEQGGKISFPVDLLKVPYQSESGFTIKGKQKQVISKYTMSYGWYVMEATKGFPVDHLKLTTERGPNLIIYARNFQLYITSGKKMSDPAIPLAVFLKAFTGSSYSELMKRIGSTSVYAMTSFNAEEPLRVECIDQVVNTLLGDFASGKKNEQYESLSAEDRLSIIQSRFLQSFKMYLGNTAGVRLRRSLSFKSRCKNLYLAEPVKVLGQKFDEGISLDSKVLDMLDYLPVDELKVVSSDRKKYSIKKASNHNFRALGCTLEEDLELEGRVIKKGTVLSLVDLKEIEQSSLEKFRVSFGEDSWDCTRTLFDGSFRIDDLIGMIQVYLDSLGGLNLYEDVYGLVNQNVDTLDIRIADLVKTNCRLLISHITDNSVSFQSGQDLMSKVLAMNPLDLDKLIEFVESAETRESQQAELNNLIQKMSKDRRVSKDVKRSSPGMGSVQESQFGRLDMVESPESSKIGTVHAMAFTAKTDEHGFLTAPYIRVKNGEVVDETPVYLTSEEQEYEFIASFDETFMEDDGNGSLKKKERVLAFSSTTFMEVPIEDVNYKQVGPYDTMSVARMMTPLPEHSQPKRLLMSANQAKQSVPLINNERPLVSSGGDSLVCEEGIVRGGDILEEYYRSQKDKLDISLEELLQRKLKLIAVQKLPSSKMLSFSIEGLEGHIAQTEIPFMQKAASGALFSYIINTWTETFYGKDDIVAYSSDIDIRKYKINLHANFGHMKVDPKAFDASMALSRNLIVVYKTFEGSTIDDAVLISKDLIDSGDFSAWDIHSITYELQPEKSNRVTGIVEQETFGFTNEPPSKDLEVTGLPKLGARMKPGDIVIGVKVEKKQASRTQGMQAVEAPKNKHITLEDTVEGEVVLSRIEGNKAIVYLANHKYAEVGDKIAGRHGNKGIIARVVPREYMPFDPETGQYADVCLNPLGIPSRGNISQLLEATLGMAMKKRGEVQIITPYVGDSLEYVKEMAEREGVKPKWLRDGRTGQFFKRKMTMMCIYLLYLEHRVSHKIKSVGISSKLDPVFNQPSKGGGGQAFGEMETWALEAIGMSRVLQDVMSLQSDDLEAQNTLRNSLNENITGLEIKGENHNDKLFQVITRCLGVEPQYDEEGALWFRPLTDSMTRALSSIPVDIHNKASLESPEIFGVTSSHMLKFGNRTTWSWMPLHTEIVHPFFIVKGKLNKFFVVSREFKKKDGTTNIETLVATEDMLKDLIAGRGSIVVQGQNYTYHNGIVEGSMTGMEAMIYMLRNTSLDVIKGYLTNKMNNAKSTKSIVRYKKHLRTIEDFEKSGSKLEDFVISSIPVMPLAFRPKAKFDHILQDFDFYYGRIMDEVSKYQTASIKTNEGVYSIYLRIAEFCGLTYGKETQVNKQYKPLIKYFTGREGPNSKHGRVRESMIKKRTLFSGRSVIIPSSDIKRPPTKIGLPYRMVVKMYGAHLLTLLRNSFDYLQLSIDAWKTILDVVATNRSAFNKFVSFNSHLIEMSPSEFYDKIYGVISSFIEGYTDPETGEVITKPQVVLAGRQPTLHKFSIRSYEVVIVHGKCIEIHPLVCSGYNADFDGDQMWVSALINEESQQEALEKASPTKGIINPKDGSVVVKHSQDMLLGLYFMTMLHNNVDSLDKDARYSNAPMVYTDTRTISDDVDLGIISVHDLVCYVRDEDAYLSTAGRILFNDALPNGSGFTKDEFTNPLEIPNIRTSNYKNLKFDGLMSGTGGSRKAPVYGSMKKVVSWMCENFSEEEVIASMQKLSELGFKQSDVSGISLSLEDLVQNPKTDLYLAKASEMAEVINDRYFKGVISEGERKEELIYLYTQTKNRIKKTFMADFDRNNNMFIMFDSGARGNEDQIMQACGVIGILQKTKDEVLETPVLSNYTKGTTAFETMQLSFSTRVGVASTQNETADSGELTRLAVYIAGGFKVVEEDCGSPGTSLKLTWGEPTGKIKSPQGETVTVDALVGKRVVGSDDVLKNLTNFLGENNTLTERAVDIILKKKFQRVRCEDGEYEIFYKPDTLPMSMLKFRYTSENLPNLINGNYISDKTLDHIVKSNMERINVRTMLTCQSVGGTCQKCYGLSYDSKKLPPVGSSVGVESAQAIGEPANQLSLSLFHQGGEAGKSADKGVELYSSVLQTGFSKRLQQARLAEIPGYVSIMADRTRPLITNQERSMIHYTSTELIVDSGEYVERNEPLSLGFVVPEVKNFVGTEEELNFIRMALLNVHFRIFEMNNINVFARHFELFARVQTSLVTVIESEDPKFKEGSTYQLNDIRKNATGKVDYVFNVARATEAIQEFGGPEVLMAHGNLASHLGSFATSAVKSKNPSFTGNLFLGQDVSGGPKKVFVVPKNVSSMKSSSSFEEVKEEKVAKSLLSSEFVEEIEKVDVSADDIDWGGLLGDLFETPEEQEPKPQIPVIDVHKVVEDEEGPEEGDLKSLKAF